MSAKERIHEAALRLFAEKGVTQVSVSELADAAGVARGTIYNSGEDMATLFERVLRSLMAEMNDRVVASFAGQEDPALRLALGIRQYVRRAHEEPQWGKFFMRFSFISSSASSFQSAAPIKDLVTGINIGRYTLSKDSMLSAVALVGGSVVGAMQLVRNGFKTWRDAGSETAELVLRSLGIPPDEARQLSTTDLPPLPPQEKKSD